MSWASTLLESLVPKIKGLSDTEPSEGAKKKRDPAARLASVGLLTESLICGLAMTKGAGRCEERWKMKVDMDGQTLDLGGVGTRFQRISTPKRKERIGQTP